MNDHEEQPPPPKPKCKHCDRPLVAIGDKRANGKRTRIGTAGCYIRNATNN